MKKNKHLCIKYVLEDEGGYVDHPKDPGGATNMGITIGTLSQWRNKKVTKQDVRNLTKNEASTIYDVLYWTPSGANELPSGLDYCAFDIAVNSGLGRVRKLLITDRATTKDNIEATLEKREAFYRSLKTFPTFGKGWLNRNRKVRTRALYLALEEPTEPVQPLPPPPLPQEPSPPKSRWRAFLDRMAAILKRGYP